MGRARIYPGCGKPSSALNPGLADDLLFHVKDCSYCKRYLKAFADGRAFKRYIKKLYE